MESCSISFPALGFSGPSPSAPSRFISFCTGRLIGPALLLPLTLPPDWPGTLWSASMLDKSSPPRVLPLTTPALLLALRLWEDEVPPVLLLFPGRGPHWVSVLCSRPLWLFLG